MLEILSRIDPRSLYAAAGPKEIEQLGRLTDPDFRRETLLANPRRLARFVLAYAGSNVLENERIRQLVTELLPSRELNRLADKHGGRSYSKTSDQALVAAKRGWREGGSLVETLRSCLQVPSEFLPRSDKRLPSLELVEPREALPDLLSHQEDLKGQISDALSAGESAFIVQMPTGAGKTRTVLEALLDFFSERELFVRGETLLWLAHTEELCEQAIDAFKDIWSQRGTSSVGAVRLWGPRNVPVWEMTGAFVVGGVAKVARLVSRGDSVINALRRSTQVMVIDEAHKAIAPAYREIVNALRTNGGPVKIGLTATPGRAMEDSSENRALARLFSRKLLAPDLGLRPLETLRERGVLARLDRYCVDSGESLASEVEDGEFDMPGKVLRRLAESMSRNRLLIDLISREVEEGSPTLVFACTVLHARLLAAALNLLGTAAAYVDCKMGRGQRRRAVEGFRQGSVNALINFGVLSTGFDAPRTKTVVISRPTSSIVLYSQMIGRGLRGPAMGGSPRCKLIDIRDNWVSFGDADDVYQRFARYWS